MENKYVKEKIDTILKQHSIFSIPEETLEALSIEEMEELTSRIPEAPKDVIKKNLDRMDTGIYDKAENLIGDRYWEEDEYIE